MPHVIDLKLALDRLAAIDNPPAVEILRNMGYEDAADALEAVLEAASLQHVQRAFQKEPPARLGSKARLHAVLDRQNRIPFRHGQLLIGRFDTLKAFRMQLKSAGLYRPGDLRIRRIKLHLTG